MASTAATTWRDLPLPDFKGQPGWEFTELRKFDLASFPAPSGGASSRPNELGAVPPRATGYASRSSLSIGVNSQPATPRKVGSSG